MNSNREKYRLRQLFILFFLLLCTQLVFGAGNDGELPPLLRQNPKCVEERKTHYDFDERQAQIVDGSVILGQYNPYLEFPTEPPKSEPCICWIKIPGGSKKSTTTCHTDYPLHRKENFTNLYIDIQYTYPKSKYKGILYDLTKTEYAFKWEYYDLCEQGPITTIVTPGREGTPGHPSGGVTCDLGSNVRLVPRDGSPPVPYPPPPDEPKLELISASTQTHPAGIGKPSTIELTAKVTKDGAAAPSVPVTFKIDVTPKSGYHYHHDINRPKGAISKTQGTTDSKGEIKLTFTAPEFAGVHTVTATCETCSNKTVAKEVWVQLPGLVPVPYPAAYSDVGYALTSIDPAHQDLSTRFHYRESYWLTPEAKDVLLNDFVPMFRQKNWGIIAMNDMSLPWGGRYESKVNRPWGGSHKEHRVGTEVDISFLRAGNTPNLKKQNQFYREFCLNKNIKVPFTILHHHEPADAPHFHVRLKGDKPCAQIPY